MSFNPSGHFPDGHLPDGFFPEASAPEFIGPNISDLMFVVGVAISDRDFSARFTGTGLTFTAVGTLPTGLSLSSAGVLSGTPTVLGTTSSLEVRASDGSNPAADSNSFSIGIVAEISSRRRRLGCGFGLGI